MEKIHAIIGAIVVLAVVGLVAMNMTGRTVTVVSDSSSCVETGDSGDDPYTAGEITYSKLNKGMIDEDDCVKTTQLSEYYCDEKGRAVHERYVCECANGICISAIK